MKIVIIGTGNVATILGRKCAMAGHQVVQVYGRNAEKAVALASELKAGYTTNLSALDTTADLYILALSDTAIPVVAKQLQLNRKLVVHTAGSVSKEVLSQASKNYGILYPLQSLRKEMTSIPVIPFLVDGNTADDRTLLFDFAQTLSEQVRVADDEERLKMHVAAVMVSNFTNHIYTLAEAYCTGEKVDFRFLLPLIEAIAQRLYDFSPSEVQTGPAARGDDATIEQHLSLLKNYPEQQELYAWFSEAIKKRCKY